MQLAQKQNPYLTIAKTFLLWGFTLTVSLLVVGFPLVVLMVTIGALLTIILQSVLPVSSVLLVSGSIIGVNILAILLGSALLTFKGVHPQEVSWLKWLHEDSKPISSPIYAACPLTCDLKRVISVQR